MHHKVALSNFYDYRVRAVCLSLRLFAHLYFSFHILSEVEGWQAGAESIQMSEPDHEGQGLCFCHLSSITAPPHKI